MAGAKLCREVSILKKQVPIQQILEAFPLLDEEGLDEEVHHCEWLLQQERKRLHAMLSSQPHLIAEDIKLLAQPEKDIGYAQALLEEYDKGFNEARLSLPKREPFAVVANNSVGIDVSHSPQGMPLVWLGKLEHGDKLYRVRTGDE